jgi:excisionase family DNA binding protein
MESLLTVESAAKVLGISPWTVRKFITTRKLRPVRIGRRVLLEECELQRLIEQGRSRHEYPPGQEGLSSESRGCE